MKNKLRCVQVSKKWEEIVTASNLFSMLDFTTTKKTDAAIVYFNDGRQHIAKTVDHLTLKNINIESQLVLSLIELFPNIKYLAWNDKKYGSSHTTTTGHAPLKEELAQKLIKWKCLRYIHDTTSFPKISACLYESCSLVVLKYLKIEENMAVAGQCYLLI